MRRTLLCGPLFALMLIPASRATADTFGSGGNSFEIEFVTIGAPGNVADTSETARSCSITKKNAKRSNAKWDKIRIWILQDKCKSKHYTYDKMKIQRIVNHD